MSEPEPVVRDPGDEDRVEQPADDPGNETYVDDDSGEPESIPED
jgi:hypothetical protein